MLYQDFSVLFGQSNDATVGRAFFVGLFNADVNHLREVAVCLKLLEIKHK